MPLKITKFDIRFMDLVVSYKVHNPKEKVLGLFEDKMLII